MKSSILVCCGVQSASMLETTKRTAHEARVAEMIALEHGDTSQVAKLFPARSFDMIVCHNILEYVDDPGAVGCGVTGARGRVGTRVSLWPERATVHSYQSERLVEASIVERGCPPRRTGVFRLLTTADLTQRGVPTDF